MAKRRTTKNLAQMVNLPPCPPEFYEHNAAIQINFREVEKPMAGYGLTCNDAIADLRKKGYQGDFFFIWIADPRKNYVFAAQ